ncbi:glycosyltransferase family 2 protein [Flavobacterium pectinovorum]|uniref:glycosyltransferase family 2 protein n=1 Tax=Flavobacterium pectinovorum TaxID=29533 RepID=UPI001FAC8DBA|nr:glycosyltransferase family 2 protein [Flavobacterium pectinovorum]MCI9844937.1 glycosyltransferase family 2 protein [Flavobacterium pectinovorum]
MYISVALCTYNGEKFIKKQLDSILNQTLKVNEIVICDDKSSDSTLAILEKYKADYPNIFKIFINESNLKSNKNFEKALSLTSGDYIFFSDQDDLWRLDKVDKIIRVFEKNKNIEGVFSNANLIDENDLILSKPITLWDTVGFFEQKLTTPVNYLKYLMIEGNFVTGATICISKNVKDFCLPFDTNEKNFFHDYWIALLLAERNSLTCINENLISYRIHINQQIGVGNISERIEKHNNKSKNYNLILGYFNPKTFKEFKFITNFIYEKYIYHKNNPDQFYSLDINKRKEENLFKLYNEAKKNMISNKPIIYFIKNTKNKIKNWIRIHKN